MNNNRAQWLALAQAFRAQFRNGLHRDVAAVQAVAAAVEAGVPAGFALRHGAAVAQCAALAPVSAVPAWQRLGGPDLPIETPL